MSLKSQTKQNLIAKAHALKPIIIIGNEGVTPTVLAEIDRALYDHELIKVRLPSGEKSKKTEIVQSLSLPLKANCLKMIGHIAILYRPSDKQQKMDAKRKVNNKLKRKAAERRIRTQKPDIKISKASPAKSPTKKKLLDRSVKNKGKIAIR